MGELDVRFCGIGHIWQGLILTALGGLKLFRLGFSKMAIKL